MKKMISMAAAAVFCIGMTGITAFAEESATDAASVYVTISDNEGKLVLTQEAIDVTDTDGDGALTISDALYAAHEAKFEGGAAAGFANETTDWGLSLTKLWGVENGGSYGYYVNNVSAMGLADPITEGDYVNAFIYTDLTAWSDKYTFFDVNTLTASEDEEVSLTLSAAGYDADYNPVTVPVEDATITLNGTATEYKTDAEGKVTFKMEESGNVVISAVSDIQTLVPPVCMASVSSAETVDTYVTISDVEGKLVLTQEKITVSDADKDGALTINDALYLAHEAKYEGGAAAGYGSSYGSYGLSMTKLWGTENGGSYGYYVNNTSAWSLADAVADGDYINAFMYTDLTAWSDKYTLFDQNTVTAETGDTITLTLSSASYDADYNPITVPVEGATITLNGTATEFKTDAEGKVTITIADAGSVVISAISASQTLVPPVCVAEISAKASESTTTTTTAVTTTTKSTTTTTTTTTKGNSDSPKTGDTSMTLVYLLLALAGTAGAICMTAKRGNTDEM